MSNEKKLTDEELAIIKQKEQELKDIQTKDGMLIRG